MKKIIFACVLAVLLSSCASVMDMPEAERPISYRLVSADAVIRKAAVAEYSGMDENEKKEAILGIIVFFGMEEDPYRRAKMLGTLDELSAGPYAIIPLIKAAASNKSIIDFREVKAYLSEHKPRETEKDGLVQMLKNGAWESRMLAMFSLSVLSREAGKAVPEIMAMINEFGRDPDRYSKIFDSIAMINPEIAIASVINDLKNPDGEIRKNALLKLMELNTYLNSKLPVKKDIVPALIRALYSADKTLSEIAEEGLRKIEDPDARQAIGNYIKMGRQALNMLYRLGGTTAEEQFRKQEEANRKKIDDYFRSVGREDAVGK